MERRFARAIADGEFAYPNISGPGETPAELRRQVRMRFDSHDPAADGRKCVGPAAEVCPDVETEVAGLQHLGVKAQHPAAPAGHEVVHQP